MTDFTPPNSPQSHDAATCCVCGATDDLRTVPMMTGDKFGQPPKYPVCDECFRAWYESGETTVEGILLHREKVENRRRAKELRAEADRLEALA